MLNPVPEHYSYRDYDLAGRQTDETSELGTIGYNYDQAGNRSRTTWPDGYHVTYAYDAANRMTSVQENGIIPLASYTYDSLSRRQLLTLGGFTQHKIAYDYQPNDRLTDLDHHLGSSVAAITFDYGYNLSGQLTSLSASDTFYLGKPRASETYSVNNLNQYTTVGSATLTYDPNGNLTRWNSPEHGVQNYTYDIENRLKSVAVNGLPLATNFYDYDGLGRRTSKHTGALLGLGGIIIGGTKTFYLLDGDEEIAEYDQNGNVLRRYVTGPAIDDRIAMIEGSSTSPAASDRHYYHTNHQGSVIATAQASGTLIDEYAYDEYGKLTDDSRASTAGQPYRYTGRRYDEETGLYYYRARYYAPELGRFLQTDPIGYGDDVNLYAYVKNDPLNYIDQSGAFVVPPGVVYGAIAGFSGGFAASGGSWKGGFVGAFAGGVVGIANPALSNRAGAFVTGALASALGQAVGSGYDAAIKSGIENTFSGVVVDPITTVAGGLGAHFGNMVGNGVATAIKARPIIGVAMQNAGMPTRTGLAAGAAVEGGITGAAERGADMFTISITQGNDGIGSDSLGGFPGSGSEGAKSLSTSCLSIRGCGGMGLNF